MSPRKDQDRVNEAAQTHRELSGRFATAGHMSPTRSRLAVIATTALLASGLLAAAPTQISAAGSCQAGESDVDPTSNVVCQAAFTATGPFTWTPPADVTVVDVLLVGGGGGGQSGQVAAPPSTNGVGGSGGTGTFGEVYKDVAVTAGVAVSGQVGQGGASSTNGDASSFGSKASGTGNGGISTAGEPPAGGGQAAFPPVPNPNGTDAVPPLSVAGTLFADWATTHGSLPATFGAGGGAGSTDQAGTPGQQTYEPGVGGTGGGGDGGKPGTTTATAGVANTGSGGGGGGIWGGSGAPGAAGGSGLVVVRYVPPAAPAQPTSLQATASSGNVSLQWVAPANTSPAITGYKIERAVVTSGTPGPWVDVAANTGNSLQSYVDSTVDPNTDYQYRVSAINTIGTGPASSVASASTPNGPALTPQFFTPGLTATSDGFTVQITNYSGAFVWVGTATNGGTATISGAGLITVTGLNAGQSSTVTVTTTRSGYASGSATVSGTAASPTPPPAPPSPGGGGSGSGETTPAAPSPAAPQVPDPTNLAPVPVTEPVPAGQAGVAVGGQPVQVSVTEVAPNLPNAPGAGGSANGGIVANGVSVAGAGFQVTASGPILAGSRESGGLVAPAAAPVGLGASGFAAGTPVNVYLVIPGQEPVLLQTQDADVRGLINGTIQIPAGATPGAAVLQINGTSGSNELLNINVGIQIEPGVAPQPEADGELPTLRTGSVVALGADGQPLPDSQTRVRDGVARLQVGSTVATIRTVDGVAERTARSTTGLVGSPNGYVRVTGRGFEANSRVSVWGFSTPVLMGIVFTDANGAYDATLPVPAALAPGDHTLQSVGTSAQGVQVSVATGLRIVRPAATETSATKKSRATVTFDRLSSTLDAQDKKVLRQLVRKVGKDNIVRSRVVGYVQASDDSSNDISLSRARALSVAAELRKLGVTGKIVTKAKGVKNAPSSKARSAQVTITFTS